MTLHFAPARHVDRSPVARVLARRATGRPANDNGDANGLPDDPVLHAALRHFASHGLGAARAARGMAEAALAEGESAEFEHWRGVCAKFDRRFVRMLTRETTAQ